jgi:hypothetical protein
MDNKTTAGISFPVLLIAFACSVLTATGILGALLWFNIYIWDKIF